MDPTEDSNMDASSIKPVSSLLSHFERMTTTRATNAAPAPGQQPKLPMRHDLKRQETWSGGRSSLDVPRRPWAWDHSPGTSQLRQETPKISSTSTLDSQMSNPLPRQRPLSIGPSSPQQHLSATSAQYSRSPPRFLQLTPHSLTPPPPAPAALTTVGRSSQSQFVKSVEQGCLPSDPSKLKLSQYASVPETALPKVSSSQTFPNGRFKRILSQPPPVNRADKPKILMKPTSDSRLAGRTILEHAETSNLNRLSPFSTPSSSEGSPNAETPLANEATVLAPTKATKFSKVYTRENQFSRPPIHHSNDEKLLVDPADLLAGKGETDARLNGFSLSEQPPSLPPRRDNNKIPKIPTDRAENFPNLQRREDRVDRYRPHASTSDRAAHVSSSSMKLLPPPKRTSLLHQDHSLSAKLFDIARGPESMSMHASGEQPTVLQAHVRSVDIREGDTLDYGNDGAPTSITNYPDVSQSNRRPPRAREGVQQIETKYDTRLFDVCGRYVCASGYLTRAWDTISGDLILNLSPGEKEVKVTSMAFKPGATAEEEGLRIWLGNNYGDIQEIDIPAQNIVQTRSGAHARREIIKIFRHQNSMWSLDDDGNLLVWVPDDRGLPSLKQSPKTHKVSKGCTFSIIIKDYLWLATGKEIRIFNPNASEDMAFYVVQQPLTQSGTGDITSGAVISSQLQRVYFGHTDGKVTIYSTTEFHCLGVINVSVYKISSLAGAGFYLWAGYNTGMMYVYDTRIQPWLVKKDWRAHDNPIAGILVDRSSVWKLGRLQVASIGLDNFIKVWDGMLEEDWLGELNQMRDGHFLNRNNDIAAILEAATLPIERDSLSRSGRFIGGGDGAMIMDHEICILNGDLNYRIDTMGRDAVIKAVKANNLSRLLERDQLLVSRRRNPGFRLRAFDEAPITFAPTYKYDVGSDKYDTSEKHRSPAWCDRLLYRGAGRIKQLHYQRHELRISDHRPVSGTFKLRIKSILPEQRLLTWRQCEIRFQEVKKTLAREAQ
ncbi:MAG: hypothetical protein Q9187_000056 [Circinaria calcarea]